MTRRPRAQARTKRAAILNPPTSPVAAGFLVGLGVSPAALDVVRNPAVVRTLRHSAIVPHLRRLRPTEGLARPPIPGTPRVPVLTDIPGCTAISPVPYPLMSFPLAYRAGHARPLTLASRELSAAHPARHTQLANAVFPIRLQSTSACKREAESRGNTRGWCDAGINLVPAAHHLQGPRLTSTADGHLRSNGTAWFATPSLPKPYRDRPRVLARGLEYFPRGTPAGFTIIRAAAGQLPGDHVPAVFVLSGGVCIKYDSLFRQAAARDRSHLTPRDQDYPRACHPHAIGTGDLQEVHPAPGPIAPLPTSAGLPIASEITLASPALELLRLQCSVNDGISREEFSFHYATVDDAVRLLLRHGIGALMAKVDLKSAFRMVPVRVEDWDLLGMYWQGNYYVDTCLPFGLQSAPYLFDQFAVALHWILSSQHSVEAIHYLDDFLLVGPAGHHQCATSVRSTLSVCDTLGVPVAFDKLEGPASRLTFLGITLDSSTQQLSLPLDKQEDILHCIRGWGGRHKATKRELLSLIGKLSFAAKVVPAGHLFLRRLIDLSTTAKKLHHHIRITVDAREDLAWWERFLPEWNGVAMFLEPDWTSAETLNLYTDASGTSGYGAYFGGSWFRRSWLPHQRLEERSIQWQELFAIVAAAKVWGPRLATRWRCGHHEAAERTLFTAAHHNFAVKLVHIPGRSTSHPNPSEAGRPLEHLLKRLARKALAPSTSRIYRVGFRRFQSFCRQIGAVPLPASWHVVALFVTHLCSFLSWKAIRVYLSSITHQHHLHSSRSPVIGNPTLHLVLRGIKQLQSQIQPRRLKPITMEVLTKLMEALRHDPALCTHDQWMLRAAISLAFFGFLRVGEFTTSTQRHSAPSLARKHVAISEDWMTVFLQFSKTDQLGKGSMITVGCTGGTCCPVRAMSLYLAHCKASRSKPLFHLKSRGPLTARFFRDTLKRILRRAGLRPSHYNTHSFRIGAATAAAIVGLPSTEIMQLGRWRSSAFQGYIHHTPVHTAAAAQMAAAP
eukprot:Em0007g853a